MNPDLTLFGDVFRC